MGTKGGQVVNSGLEHAQIPETQFQQWSEQVSGQSLPLKTFLTQHRPLMAVPLHIAPQQIPRGAQNPRDVMFVGAWRPKSNIFSEQGYQSVPLQIAQELGPFEVSSAGAPKETAREMPVQISRDEMPRNVVESVGVLGQFLREYNSQGGSEGAMMHLPLHEGRAYLEFEGGEVDATSVRRKRKLKMNRHKYRKRLKEQRTLRRRLNSGK